MRVLIKRVFIITGFFFVVNMILLFGLKKFPSVTSNNEPVPPIFVRTVEKQASIKFSSKTKANQVAIPVLVFACNRARALELHLQALLKIREDPKTHPIIVSLDCHDEKTMATAKSFSTHLEKIIELPDLGPLDIEPRFSHMPGYYKISRHYNYSINHVLNVLNYEAVIITEDDLEISPDFLDYFYYLYPVLKLDPSIWCISAWNDNGIDRKILRDPTLLHRTDFFPGLGWLLTRNIWNEIKDRWPRAFWDDWMRLPEQRRDRVCIRPEISRTAMSLEGKKGVSRGQHFERYLKKIIKNTEPVDWKSKDLTYLTKELYDPFFEKKVEECQAITLSELSQLASGSKCVQIRYSNNKEFVAIADSLGIMNDFKSNVPRTAYRGIVQCQYESVTVFVRPSQRPWVGYK